MATLPPKYEPSTWPFPSRTLDTADEEVVFVASDALEGVGDPARIFPLLCACTLGNQFDMSREEKP